jgi:hypothetical protein
MHELPIIKIPTSPPTRRRQAASLLESGLSPARIAQQMNVTVDTVMGYLYNQIGEGNIRRSDILFAMDAETRSATEQLKRERTEWPMSEFWREIRQPYPAVHADDAWIYFSLNKPEVYLSDMYAWLYTLEQFFHVYIKVTLEKGGTSCSFPPSAPGISNRVLSPARLRGRPSGAWKAEKDSSPPRAALSPPTSPSRIPGYSSSRNVPAMKSAVIRSFGAAQISSGPRTSRRS